MPDTDSSCRSTRTRSSGMPRPDRRASPRSTSFSLVLEDGIRQQRTPRPMKSRASRCIPPVRDQSTSCNTPYFGSPHSQGHCNVTRVQVVSMQRQLWLMQMRYWYWYKCAMVNLLLRLLLRRSGLGRLRRCLLRLLGEARLTSLPARMSEIEAHLALEGLARLAALRLVLRALLPHLL